jgi:DNA transformation protein
MDDERIAELFESLGPVSIRRMFGGKGIYFDGVIIAVEFAANSG